jgi:hypothetical protein
MQRHSQRIPSIHGGWKIVRRRHHMVQTTDARMEDEPPSWLNYWVKLHVLGPTHVAHEVACTPSSMCSLFHEFRMKKIYLSYHFGIIINYYLQDLSSQA